MSHNTFGAQRASAIAMLLWAMAMLACEQSGEHTNSKLGQLGPGGSLGVQRRSVAGTTGIRDAGALVLRDPFDAVPGDYSGSVTIGDSRDGGLIPNEFLRSIDLGLSLRRTDTSWSGELSFQRFVTTNPTSITQPDCQNVPSRELKAALESVSVVADAGTFQATSAPMRFCVSSNKAVERRLQLQGTFATRNNCAHVEVRGPSYGNYHETARGLITLPSGNTTDLVGTFVLTKFREAPDAGPPGEGDQCPDLNPDSPGGGN